MECSINSAVIAHPLMDVQGKEVITRFKECEKLLCQSSLNKFSSQRACNCRAEIQLGSKVNQVSIHSPKSTGFKLEFWGLKQNCHTAQKSGHFVVHCFFLLPALFGNSNKLNDPSSSCRGNGSSSTCRN